MAAGFPLWSLGAGVVLGWLVLPCLVKLARWSQLEAPATYYRTLVWALALATASVFLPIFRAWSGLGIELSLREPPRPWVDAQSLGFIAEWVKPLLGAPEGPWSSMPLARLLSGVGLAWLLVLGIGVAHSMGSRLELGRVYRCGAVAPPRVLVRAKSIADELGVELPEIRVVEGVPCAFTLGFFSPVVVLGAAACSGAEAELDFVLRHELLHVARKDTRAAFWIELAQRCFTGHPSVCRLAAEIRFAREARVDELAAGAAPLEYARFLLASAERMRSARATSSSWVAMADTALERRVEMLMTPTEKTSRVWRSSSLLGLSGLVLGALVFLAPSSFGQGAAASSGGSPLEVVSPPLEESNERAAGAAGGYGHLPPELIRKIVRESFDRLRVCYEELPRPRPELRTKMDFTIGRDGKVSDGRVDLEAYPRLERCIDGVMRSLVFPAPEGGIVTVVYPLMFGDG